MLKGGVEIEIARDGEENIETCGQRVINKATNNDGRVEDEEVDGHQKKRGFLF